MGILFERHLWLIQAAVIAACAMYTGRIGAHLLPDRFPSLVSRASAAVAAPDDGRPKDPSEIVRRNVFCSTCPGTRPGPAGEGDRRGGGVKRSTLPIELVSTMYVAKDRRWSMAIFRDAAGASAAPGHARGSRLYWSGQRIEDTDAEIVRIDPRRV